MSALSPTQSRVLAAVKALIVEANRSPTCREVAARVGFPVGYTHRVLKAVERKGRIARKPFTHRGITITDAKASS